MLTRLSEDAIHAELTQTSAAIEHVTGFPPSIMRPSYGAINERVTNTTAELGLPMILWSLDPADWLTRNADMTYERIMEQVTDRDIILLHDIHEPTAEAAIRIIPSLIDRGFQLVTVSELLYYSSIVPEGGAVYLSGDNNG